VNSVPALGRFRATVVVAAGAISLSAFPDFVNHAQRWIVHLGNVAAPLAGVILVDYVVLKRRQIDLGALFEPEGRYRYLNGLNVAAVLAVAAGVGVYYSLPHAWLKVLWGTGVGAVAYFVLAAVQASAVAAAAGRATVTSARSSSSS
jgi:nucleobase:cation symporter-1, NCS1 family